MNLHALTTGRVKIKTRFYSGKGAGIFRKLNVFLDKNFTNKMPIHSYLIEHKEGNDRTGRSRQRCLELRRNLLEQFGLGKESNRYDPHPDDL